MLEILKTYSLDLFHLFYPRICASCANSLNSSEKAICLSCKYNYKRPKFHDDKNNEVEKRFWGKIKVKAASAHAQFIKDGLLQKAIYELKYKQNTLVGEELGKELGYELKNSARFKDVDLVLPVPLHKIKKRKRGYNQCDFIAKGVAEAMEIEWSVRHIRRNVYNISQTGKSKYGRFKNTENIFEAYGDGHLNGRNILLVDDVITTGATIEACVNALNKVEGAEIYVASVAYA
ncbi:MAG: ComF family protein [Flavobacteriales bacterium]|nr:ComF family protein [Flavobacteriales bacterium]